MTLTTTRRNFLGGSSGLALSLKFGAVGAAGHENVYRRWEDIMRNKWTWDRVVRGSRGLNCTGHCAFNIFVKNGIVWREEQQGEYGHQGDDTPDFGPRGCQKGLRQHKYMYGKQRVLYPMRRIGERGEGKWERISWDDALTQVADKFIDIAVEDGPESITYAMGTAMILKRAGFAGLFRFSNILGNVIPETFAGVGDLPVGANMTLGFPLPGDSMPAVFKSKTCLIWACNPAATRIPDAHFFWEARYNGTEVICISPEFSPTAVRSSKWVNPKPGSDAALALGMVHVMIRDNLIDWDYVKEQTDMPFLVRASDQKFLRESDFVEGGRDDGFYFWDEASGQPQAAPGTGFSNPFAPPDPNKKPESLVLGDLQPAVEGSWTVETADGPTEVTTVFEFLKTEMKNYTPEQVQTITGVAPGVIEHVATAFATNGPGMIFAGYRANKWLHGDLVLRSWLLMCALTGNTGREGGGMQTTQLPRAEGIFGYVFAGLGPRLRIAAISVWDYANSDGRANNERVYGKEFADHIDKHYQEAKQKRWLPDYAAKPWRMALMAGHNPANWRATGEAWRESALSQVELMVAMTPDMSATALSSDIVLPVAHHYEVQDMTMEGRTPYLQVIDEAVPPLGESLPDWKVQRALIKKISERAKARGITTIKDNMFGQPIERDYANAYEAFTLNGQISEPTDLVEFMISNQPGLPNVTWEELSKKGFVRVDDSKDVQFGKNSAFNYETLESTREKHPWKTLTGRQQFYIDQETFLAEGEALPVHKEPLTNKGFDLRLTMGHARHGIHSWARDDSLLVSLQRGEPDVYVNPDDAQARGVADGDLIRVHNDFGDFVAMAHVSSGMQPSQMFMYHGWDPTMFRNRRNFSSVISTGGLIKPVQMVGDYGHLRYQTPDFVPNQTYHDCTVEFEKFTGDA
ncbi:MAG: molybdopterin-dependent oxidoreductase [Gammaproteobacteria bacterium]|nr:molybdopterin-dependent oxidoreductase [Gammaproteobacteria bacterium]